MAETSLSNNQVINKIGDVCGYWTIIAETEPYLPDRKTQWRCRCICGTERVVRQSSLRDSKRINSCGCMREAKPLGLGNTNKYRSTYSCWAAMKQRCLNPNHRAFKYYGGKGVLIHPSWLRFENFLADMGERPGVEYSIERKNPKGNYHPDNCCWATREQQSANTSRSRKITIEGETKTLMEWCRHYNVPFPRVHTRLRLGWDTVQAFTTPASKTALRATRLRDAANTDGQDHPNVERWLNSKVHPRTLRRHEKGKR